MSHRSADRPRPTDFATAKPLLHLDSTDPCLRSAYPYFFLNFLYSPSSPFIIWSVFCLHFTLFSSGLLFTFVFISIIFFCSFSLFFLFTFILTFLKLFFSQTIIYFFLLPFRFLPYSFPLFLLFFVMFLSCFSLICRLFFLISCSLSIFRKKFKISCYVSLLSMCLRIPCNSWKLKYVLQGRSRRKHLLVLAASFSVRPVLYQGK